MSEKLIKEYKQLGKRKYREKRGKSIIEGYYLLTEALLAGIKVEVVFYTEEVLSKELYKNLLQQVKDLNIDAVEVDSRTFEQMAQTETPQGIGAIINLPNWNIDFTAHENTFFIVLDGVQDPGNAGTVIRTAAAAGINGVLILPGTADPFNPKALRASMGGIFHLPVVQRRGLEFCEEALHAGIKIIAAAPRGNYTHYEIDYSEPSAVLIGNESKGVSKYLKEKASVVASIPLPGKLSSLNASVAASVFIFESLRQRGVTGR